jgi:hypothetical protein
MGGNPQICPKRQGPLGNYIGGVADKADKTQIWTPTALKFNSGSQFHCVFMVALQSGTDLDLGHQLSAINYQVEKRTSRLRTL